MVRSVVYPNNIRKFLHYMENLRKAQKITIHNKQYQSGIINHTKQVSLRDIRKNFKYLQPVRFRMGYESFKVSVLVFFSMRIALKSIKNG